MVLIPIIAIIAVLIFITAFYVAAEFSAVSAKRSKLAQMAAEGNVQATVVLNILENPLELDAFVAACQLGITLASLILGFYGQSQLTGMIAPLVSGWVQNADVAHSIATTAVLIALTVLTVILGELIPKNLGVQIPERLVILTAGPMLWSIRLFRPLIWLLNGSGQLILRLFGQSPVAEHVHVHSPEEIRMLVEESSAGGMLAQTERRLLINTLELRKLTARKAMIPRNRIVAAHIELSRDDLLTRLAASPYSRLPLYEGTIDNVVGVVHLKDLINLKFRADQASVRSIMHRVGYVPESMSVEHVLRTMQREHLNVAIVVDEYGGTSGMVTIEDLFEEIIGEFNDEFDADRAMLQLHADARVVMRGDIHIADLNEWLGIELPTDSFDTIGGLVFGRLGKLPVVGDTAYLPYRGNSSSQTESARGESESTQEVVSTEKEPTDTWTAVWAELPEPPSGLLVQVERIYRNSVAEISFTVTPEQAEHLRQILEQGIE